MAVYSHVVFSRPVAVTVPGEVTPTFSVVMAGVSGATSVNTRPEVMRQPGLQVLTPVTVTGSLPIPPSSPPP